MFEKKSKTDVLLAAISEDFNLIRKGNYYTTEEHDSLIIDPSKGMFFWNSKGIMGDATSYLMQVRGHTYNSARNEEVRLAGKKFDFEVFEVQPQTPNIAMVEVFYNYGKEYRDYWYDKRGYTDETIDEFFLGYTGKYWVIPIFADGMFKNFQIRGYDTFGNKIVKNYYSGIGRLPFNFGNLPSDKSEEVYITESIVDAIMLMQNGLFAISHNSGTNGWDHEWSQLLMDYKNLFIAFDNDEAGVTGSVRTSKYLKHNSQILAWPSKFPNKYDLTDLYKDGGSLDDLREYFLPSYLF